MEVAQKQYKIDMLHGSLWNKLIAFSLPIAATSILQQLFNSADVAVVGRFAGSAALAAVGANVANVGVFVNFLVGFAVGPNVVLCRLIGRQLEKEAKKIPGTTIVLSIIMGLFLMILGEIITVPILKAISTPEEVLQDAALYFQIYLTGLPFLAIYNFGSALLRSVGDTKRPLICLIVSGVLNVILNLFFVIVLKMSVSGVSLATVISTAVSAIMVLVILVREKGILHLGKNILKPDFAYMARILFEGIPAGIQSAIFSVSNMFVQSGINKFGSDAIAGSSAGLNFEYFTWDIGAAFAQGAVTFSSQNYGASNFSRSKKILLICLTEGFIFTGLLSLIFVIFRNQVVLFYTADPKVIDFAIRRMMLVMSLEAFTAIYEIGCGALRGIGKSILPSILTILGTVVFRMIWLLTVFRHFQTYESLMLVYIASWNFTSLLVLPSYFIVISKQIKNSKIKKEQKILLSK